MPYCFFGTPISRNRVRESYSPASGSQVCGTEATQAIWANLGCMVNEYFDDLNRTAHNALTTHTHTQRRHARAHMPRSSAGRNMKPDMMSTGASEVSTCVRPDRSAL
jgi:hypothetical protein